MKPGERKQCGTGGFVTVVLWKYFLQGAEGRGDAGEEATAVLVGENKRGEAAGRHGELIEVSPQVTQLQLGMAATERQWWRRAETQHFQVNLHMANQIMEYLVIPPPLPRYYRFKNTRQFFPLGSTNQAIQSFENLLFDCVTKGSRRLHHQHDPSLWITVGDMIKCVIFWYSLHGRVWPGSQQ